MNTIAVDAMGGDDAPRPEVIGAVAAARTRDVEVILVGDETRLRLELDRLGAAKQAHLRIQHAGEVVTMSDNPAKAFRQKKDSSLRVAFDLVVDGKASAVVSAGNSGAVLGHALFLLKRLPAVERPGITTVFPSRSGAVVLCDAGANVEARPSMVAQFGVLGACYDRICHQRARPRVGLLSNGTEPSKGTDLTRAAHDILTTAAAAPDAQLDYVGYVEGAEIFGGVCDVVATDGWTGNVVLKSGEGVATMLFSELKRELKSSLRGQLAAALARPALESLRKRIDYAETGGALLLGVRGVTVLCHGRSDAIAIENAIAASDRFVRDRLVDRLEQTLRRHEALWEQARTAG